MKYEDEITVEVQSLASEYLLSLVEERGYEENEVRRLLEEADRIYLDAIAKPYEERERVSARIHH